MKQIKSNNNQATETGCYLEPGVYELAPDCHAFSRAGKVVVTVKKRTRMNCPRCRDCKHFGHGYANYNGLITHVCFNRPKALKLHRPLPEGFDGLYYAVRRLSPACDNFATKD